MAGVAPALAQEFGGGMPALLTDTELTAELPALPGVHVGDGELVAKVTLPGFAAAVQLIVDVARVAEEMDHHPDIDLRFDTVTFTLSTHSEGGITALDTRLAGQILSLAASAGGVLAPIG